MMGANSSAGVAIVGIACRFPGAADHSAFWRNLCEGVESISTLSDDDLVSAGVPCRVVARSVLCQGRRIAAGYRSIRCCLLRTFAAGSAAHGSAAASTSGSRMGGLRGCRTTRRKRAQADRSLHGRRRSREQLSRRSTALERGPTSRSRARRPRYPRRSHDCFIGRSPRN